MTQPKPLEVGIVFLERPRRIHKNELVETIRSITSLVTSAISTFFWIFLKINTGENHD